MSGRITQLPRRYAVLAVTAALVTMVAACSELTGGTVSTGSGTGSGTAAAPSSQVSTPATGVGAARTPSSSSGGASTPLAVGGPTATSAASSGPVSATAGLPAVFSANGSGFSQIDPQTGKVVNTTSTAFSVRDIAVSPDGRTAYIVVGSPKLASLPGLGASSNQPSATGTTTSGTTGASAMTGTPIVGTSTAETPSGTATPGASTGTGSTGGSASGLIIYDLVSKSQTGQVAVGADPWAVVLSKDGRFAYVSNRGDGTVSVVDTTSRTATATLTAGTKPSGLAIVGQGAGVTAVTTTGTATAPRGSATPATGTPTAGTPISVTTPGSAVGTATPGASTGTGSTSGFTGATGFLYVANFGSNDVSVVDLATNRVVNKITVGTGPVAVAADDANSRVFVADLSSSDLSVIGVASNQVDSKVRLDGKPSAVAVSLDGRLVYVTLIAPTNAVQVVNPLLISAGGAVGSSTMVRTPTVGTPIAGTTGASAMTGTPTAGTPISVTTPGSAVGTATPGASTGTGSTSGVGSSRISVGENPSDVVFNSQGTRAYVANEDGGSISTIDTAVGAVVNTTQVPGTPSMLDFVMGSASGTPSAVDTSTGSSKPATTGTVTTTNP